MKKYEKEILQARLNDEKAVLKAIEKEYKSALDSINEKIAALLGRQDADLQHVIYQVEYQKALKAQIEGILNQLQAKEFETISEYLANCYEQGFLGSMYSMHQQGIPLILPIDQKAVAKAVQIDSKISEGLYTRLGKDIKDMKKTIASEVSRGIASSLTYSQIAKNVNYKANIGMNRAKRIARTEGGRIQSEAAMDSLRTAQSKGVESVKIWNAALDSRTRPSHRQVDGEVREIEEKFSNGLMFPLDPNGGASEVVNCRCALMQKSKWALGEEELQRMKDRADYYGLTKEKAETLEKFQKKYKIAVNDIENSENNVIIQPDKEISERFKKLPDDIVKRSSEISTILDDYTSRQTKWSGQTVIGKIEDMPGVSGRKEWSCDVTLREDTGIKTAIHEHLHARSVSYYSDIEYLRWQNAEEGVVELFAQEICKSNGVPYRESYGAAVKQLRIANSIMKEYESELDFAKAIFEVDLPDRYSWLKTKVDETIAKGKLSAKSIQALKNAVEYFA